jgi:hypothetical protein
MSFLQENFDSNSYLTRLGYKAQRIMFRLIQFLVAAANLSINLYVLMVGALHPRRSPSWTDGNVQPLGTSPQRDDS